MRPLRDLRELERIAEQHDVARSGRYGDCIGERDLPRLIYEEVVEYAGKRRTREEPRGAGGELVIPLLERFGAGLGGNKRVCQLRDVLRIGVAFGVLVKAGKREATFVG